MKHIISDTKKFLFKNKKSLLLFELFYKAGFFVVMIPFIKYALKITLKLSGFSYLTIENIVVFLRAPGTIAALILLLLVVGIFITIEYFSIIIYCYSCMKRREIQVDQILIPGIVQAKKILKWRNWAAPILGVITAVFIMLPLVIAVLTQMRIPNYVLRTALKDRLFLVILFLVVLIACFIAYRGMFVFQYMSLEDYNLKKAFQKSAQLQKGHHLQILKNFFIWNLILVVIYFLLYYGTLFISAFLTYLLVNQKLVYIAFLRVYEQVSLYVGIFVAVIAILANLGLFTILFVKYQEKRRNIGISIEKMQKAIALTEKEKILNTKKKTLIFKRKYNKILTLLAIVVIGINCGYIYDNIRNGSMITQETLFGTYITSHRGASAVAPENTIPALQKAIELLSDYAEIDVQETKDGVVILLHDSSLKRTAKISKNIWEVPYMELIKYDAGSWFSKEFENTRIPTLAEVLQLCKGRINLNIEIKVNGHEKELIEKVVRMIEQYDFEQQCVISSTSYRALAKVKELNQNLKTGYILSLAYGDFYTSEFADFFSVKSSFINEDMVRLSHRLGKEIHAWTVNSRTELERMKQLGVDNIITDKPLLAREVLYQEDKPHSFLELFKKLLTYIEQ